MSEEDFRKTLKVEPEDFGQYFEQHISELQETLAPFNVKIEVESDVDGAWWCIVSCETGHEFYANIAMVQITKMLATAREAKREQVRELVASACDTLVKGFLEDFGKEE